MNLQSKKARIPIAALGVTALCTAGLGVMASSASAAPSALTLNSGGTSPVVANLGYADTAAAGTAYAQKVTDADSAVSLKLLSEPTGGQLAYNKITSNGPATTSFSTLGAATNEIQTATEGGAGLTSFTLTFSGQTTGSIAAAASAATVQAALVALSNIDPGDVTVTGSTGGPYSVTFSGQYAATNVPAMTATPTGGTGTVTIATPTPGVPDVASLSTVAASSYVYVTGNVPGTYTFQYFQDTNTNNQLDTADERASAVVSMTVVDAGGTGTTTATSDDVAPTITATTPSPVGQAVTATLGYTKSLSLSDARGSGVASSLKAFLAALTFVDIDDTGTGIGDTLDNAATYTASTGETTLAVGTPGTAGSLALRADLKPTAAGDNLSYGSKTVTVESNGITSVTPVTATEVTGSVAYSTPNVTVKTGTGAVTYTAKVVNGTTATDVADKTVNFTLTPGTNTPALTADGTLVSSSSGTKVYSAKTDGNGVATLVVTSGTTTAGTTYTVVPRSNGQAGTTQTATYAAAAATTFASANTATELNPTVPSSGTGSVVIKGKLTDQFGAGFAPASPASTPAEIDIDVNNTTYATTDVTGFATIGADGTFSYTYTPAVAPTAGQSDYIRFRLNGGAPTMTSGYPSIKWTSAASPASITLTTPASGATGVTLQDHTAPDRTQSNAGSTPFGNTTGAITGTVKDSGGTALAFKSVTLTGEGVLFNTTGTTSATDKLVPSLTVVTDSSGAISGAYAFFTKSGTITITALSGAATKAITVTTDDASDPYKITANSVTGKPGTTIALTGKITDAFGNNVVGETAHLTLSDSSVGVLADSAPETDSNGTWSTTISPASNQEGEVTVTARLDNGNGTTLLTANPTAAAAWATAGQTIADGVYKVTSKLTVTESPVEIAVTASLIGGGKAQITGTAEPGASVDLYSRPSGAPGFELVKSLNAASDGTWGIGTTLTKTTSFFARSNGKTSSTVTSVVYSTQSVKAKALGKGKVRFTVLGTPNVKGVVNIYYGSKRLAHVTTDSHGDVTVVVQSKAGKRTFLIYFVAPGTSLKGKALTGTVK